MAETTCLLKLSFLFQLAGFQLELNVPFPISLSTDGKHLCFNACIPMQDAVGDGSR